MDVPLSLSIFGAFKSVRYCLKMYSLKSQKDNIKLKERPGSCLSLFKSLQTCQIFLNWSMSAIATTYRNFHPSFCDFLRKNIVFFLRNVVSQSGQSTKENFVCVCKKLFHPPVICEVRLNYMERLKINQINRTVL